MLYMTSIYLYFYYLYCESVVPTYANPPTTYTQGHTFLLGQGWEKTGVYVIIPPVTGSVYTRLLPAIKTLGLQAD